MLPLYKKLYNERPKSLKSRGFQKLFKIIKAPTAQNSGRKRYNMKKTMNVDLFQADKAMGERVADFMQKKVWGITLTARYKKDVETIEKSIEGLRKLEGSILQNQTEENVKALEARIVELKAALDKQKEEEATFTYTDADLALYEAYKKATTNAMIYNGIVKWFSNYHLDVDGTMFIQNIMAAISGKQPENNKGIIRSGATKFNSEKRTKTNFLKVFYGELAEAMLKAGTLKPTAIPEDVREFYAPKKKDKKEKKAKKGE